MILPWKLFTCLLISISITSGSTSATMEEIVCSQPASFTSKTPANQNVVVYNTELLIAYDPRVAVYAYTGTEHVNVLFTDSVINYKGHMALQSNVEYESEVILWEKSGSILGSGELTKAGDSYAILKPRLFLSPKHNGSCYLPLSVQRQIVEYAKTCLLSSASQYLQNLRSDSIQIDEFNTIAASKTLLESTSEEYSVCESPELSQKVNANALVEFALIKFRQFLIEKNYNKLDMPNIKESFKTGSGFWSIRGNFEATSGIFEDLTTLMRKGDVILSQHGEKYTFNGRFGLKAADLYYKKYTLAYGIFKVNGAISGNIDGLTIEGQVTINYESLRCTTKVDYIKVQELGKLSLKITGLGPLNSWVSKLLSYVTRIWRDDAVKMIETNLKKFANEEIHGFNCKSVKRLITGRS